MCTKTNREEETYATSSHNTKWQSHTQIITDRKKQQKQI